jgi:hypothetical protein
MERKHTFDPRQLFRGLPPHAFAFKDEPGSGDPTGDPDPNPDDNPQDPVEPPQEDNRLTQDEVNRVVQQRLERERQQFQKQLKDLGFDQGLDGLKNTLEQQKEAERQKLEEAKQYKTLYEQVRAEKDQELQRKEQELQSIRTQHQNERVNSTLTAAASKAINPGQVVALVKDRVKVSDDGTMYVVDDMGNRMTDGVGNMLTPRQYVETFLEQNPHFKPASSGRGGNSNPPGGNNPPSNPGGEVDLERANNDPVYFQKNLDKIRDMIASGQIKA